jgi:hypothetical protein
MNNQPKTPHFMAIYIDNDFKKGFRTLTQAEVETK